MLPPIKGFIENTLIDWEGKVAAEVFLPGCNFRCGYCHAAHLVTAAATLETIPFDAVINSIKRNEGWLDGVVISGGEPTLHEGLRDLILRFRAEGLAIKLDTNGTRAQTLDGLLRDGLLDCVSMDVKAPLDHRYAEVTRVECDVDAIAESIALVIGSGIDHEFRTTVCPAYSDLEDVVEIARSLAGTRRYVLQTFRPVNCLDPKLLDVQPYDADQMKRMAAAASAHVPNCFVRGDLEGARIAGGPAGAAQA